jgi:hypothetical protein
VAESKALKFPICGHIQNYRRNTTPIATSHAQAVSYGPNNIKLNFMDANVREVLMPLAIFSGFGGTVYFFVKTMTDYMLKKKMIDKGFVNDDTQAIFKQHASESKYASLKWGLIAFFGGLSLMVMEFVDVQPESPLPYGMFAVFVSIGFLLYYVIVKKETK